MAATASNSRESLAAPRSPPSPSPSPPPPSGRLERRGKNQKKQKTMSIGPQSNKKKMISCATHDFAHKIQQNPIRFYTYIYYLSNIIYMWIYIYMYILCIFRVFMHSMFPCLYIYILQKQIFN
jgi:hypothetical protein